VGKKAKKRQPDLVVSGGGTLYILTPVTDAGREWIDSNVDPDAQRWGDGIAVEHRYIGDIVAGAQGDGLVVQ
jgi:hypothetical protein